MMLTEAQFSRLAQEHVQALLQNDQLEVAVQRVRMRIDDQIRRISDGDAQTLSRSVVLDMLQGLLP